jgi:hypothetical protein
MVDLQDGCGYHNARVAPLRGTDQREKRRVSGTPWPFFLARERLAEIVSVTAGIWDMHRFLFPSFLSPLSYVFRPAALFAALFAAPELLWWQKQAS